MGKYIRQIQKECIRRQPEIHMQKNEAGKKKKKNEAGPLSYIYKHRPKGKKS